MSTRLYFPAGGLSRALPKALQICSSGTCDGYRAIVVEIFELDEIKPFQGGVGLLRPNYSPVLFDVVKSTESMSLCRCVY